ncbi:MAG: histidine kinase [Cohnella sp.]|nr:histidine kinase [Cohnella sp.]
MRSLRTLILQRILIVATASFLLSAGFTYYYYQNLLVGQMLRDDGAKLKQTVRQLQYMADDIVNFSASLSISGELQSFFKTYGKLDTFDKFAKLMDTFNYLNDNKGLRKEVMNFALVMPGGETFWSEARYDDYFAERMKEKWYQNARESGQTNAFSEPHPIFFNATKQSMTISYIVKIKDVQVSGKEIGEMILNLDYSSFESLLAFASSDFDGFIWINDRGDTLFEDSKSAENLSRLTAHASRGTADGPVKIPGGYLTAQRVDGSNWTLVSFTSNHSLMVRSKVVLYLLAVFSLTSTVLILVLMMPAILRITKPIMQLYNAMNVVSSGNLQTSVTIRTGDELEKLGQGFNRMIEQLRVHLEESIRYEQEKRKMELELLLSQFNPHFVYNTLNAVIYMARKQGNDDIVRMVGSFIRILQDAVNKGGDQALIPLRDEAAILRDYIAIQSYRYTDMFEVEWDIDECTLDCLIPRYLIQPFVENAIFHGICPKETAGTIRISVCLDRSRLRISVDDDGVGIEQERLAHIWDHRQNAGKDGLRHIGLSNTRTRLEHLFGGQAVLGMHSEPGKGTKVMIEVPAQWQENEAEIGRTPGIA